MYEYNDMRRIVYRKLTVINETIWDLKRHTLGKSDRQYATASIASTSEALHDYSAYIYSTFPNQTVIELEARQEEPSTASPVGVLGLGRQTHLLVV